MQDDKTYQRARQLQERLDALEVKLGDACGLYVEVTSELAPFLSRYRSEVLRYHRALVQAQREIADVRTYLGDKIAAHEGEAQSPLDDFLRREEASVQEQYDLRWGSQESSRLKVTGVPPASSEIKTLYAMAVAKLHPELARTAGERRSRIGLFNQLNAAYLKRDAHALRIAIDMMTPRTTLPAVVDGRAIQNIQDRIYALEELIARLEGQTYDFRYGDVARVHAHAMKAEAQGQDLIAELSGRVQTALRRATEELQQLKEHLDQLEE